MSDPNSIYVNYSGVSNVVDALNQANNTIQNAYETLQNDLAPLRATWSGASEAEWVSFQARYAVKYGDMAAIPPKISQAISDMSDNYATTDNKLASQWASNP